MTDRSHLRFGEDPYGLDDLTVERLVRGLPPEDAPPLYREAASALAALRASSAPAELAGEAEMVAAMAAVIAPGPTYPRRSRMLTKLLTAKAAAAVAAGVFSLGGVAAAATGSLPAPLQQAVANLAAPVVQLPGATPSVDATTTTTAVPETTTTTVAQVPEVPVGVTGEPTTTTSLVPGSPAACAAATTHGEYVSGVARDRSTKGRDHGVAVSTAAKSDCGKPDPSTTTTSTPDTQTTDTTVAPAASTSGSTDGQDTPDGTAPGSTGAPDTSHRPSTTSTTSATPTGVTPSSGSHGKGDRPATDHAGD